MIKTNEYIKFNIFSFISTFARSLIEIFISLYLFKNGFSLKQVLLFYFLVNISAIPLSYLFVKIGEKTKYIFVIFIGIIAFISVQMLLRNIINTNTYLVLIAILYSIYRRGYWVGRRFYITKIMPTDKSSGVFSIIMVLSQIASILAGIIGAKILTDFSITNLTILSSVLLFISIIPLATIKYSKTENKICLKDNLKKYNKNNYIIFSMYELNNLLLFIFPIYIAISIENSYTLAGSLSIISNVAIILCVLLFGKILNLKKNKSYIVICTILVILCALSKLYISSYIIAAIYFIEGIVTKLQNQSVNKIYFENRGDMDLTHYNLIYQITECFGRAIITLPLLLLSDIRQMILFVIIVIIILLIAYKIINTKESSYSIRT